MSILFEIECKTDEYKYCTSVSYAYNRGDYALMNDELVNID